MSVNMSTRTRAAELKAKGCRQAEIARKLNVSRQRIGQILGRANRLPPKRVKLKCAECGKLFYLHEREIKYRLSRKKKQHKPRFFCSYKCSRMSLRNLSKWTELKCPYCGRDFSIRKLQMELQLKERKARGSTTDIFCSHSCAAKARWARINKGNGDLQRG